MSARTLEARGTEVRSGYYIAHTGRTYCLECGANIYNAKIAELFMRCHTAREIARQIEYDDNGEPTTCDACNRVVWTVVETYTTVAIVEYPMVKIF
jgi:hypothetical protein